MRINFSVAKVSLNLLSFLLFFLNRNPRVASSIMGPFHLKIALPPCKLLNFFIVIVLVLIYFEKDIYTWSHYNYICI